MREIDNITRRCGTIIVLSLLSFLLFECEVPASAAPWWWVHFSKGDDNSAATSNTERWLEFAVNNATVNDTVYAFSFTWGSGNWDMINGLDPSANNVGLNALASAKTEADPYNYIFVDSDDSTTGGVPGSLTADINNDSRIEPGSPNGQEDSHNKLLIIPGKFVITGSMNFTGGAATAQPNDALEIRVPSVINRYVEQAEEFRAGTWHDNTATGPPYYFNSPNGDTIELYFGPDDNNHIPTGSGPGNADAGGDVGGDPADPTILGVVDRVLREANQSAFYMLNIFTSSDEFDSANVEAHLKAMANAGKLVEGCWYLLDNSPANAMRDRLQLNHESRDANTPYTNTFHIKAMVIDQEKVITGSANYSASGMVWTDGNDENKVVIDDFRLARKYLAYYRYLLNTQVIAPDGVGANTFETAPPIAPTNFTVTATPTYFNATWTASPSTDVTRYFLFISTSNIDTKAIGDGIDNEGDGYIDEDPVGDADFFASGTDLGDMTANDDDADGSSDEDPWMYPEVQVKGRSSTSGVISTQNVGDALASGTNYYFAIVAVDTHGNESVIDTYGPVQLGSSDTRLVVQKNSDLSDSNPKKGYTNVVTASLFIRGDTTGAGDTLTRVAVKNLGTADSLDMTVKLWRDENNDSKIMSGVDSYVAQCIYNFTTGRYEATITNDSRAYLGSGATAGRTFLIALDIFDTATTNDSFQVRIDAQTCSSLRRDSGPLSAVTISSKFTFNPADQVSVTQRGEYASATIAKGTPDSMILSMRLSVDVANDTLTGFTVGNTGTMTSADISLMKLYHDAGSDSVLTGADTLIATLQWDGSNWSADTISYYFAGDSIDLITTISISAGATGGRTFTGKIPASSVKTTKAETGPLSQLTSLIVVTIESELGADSDIVINELQENPGSSSDIDGDGDSKERDEEYVEVFNRGTKSVDLAGWTMVTSNSGENIVITSGESVILNSGWFGVFKSETTPQAANARFWIYNDSGNLVDSKTYSTNNWTTASGVFNSSNDTAYLKNSSGTIIDSYGYVSTTNGDSPFYRYLSGFNSFKKPPGTSPSFGKPNGRFTVSAVPSAADLGESFTLNITALDHDVKVITAFDGTVYFSVDTGTIVPTTSNSFSSGVLSESVSITGLTSTESVTIKVSYNVSDTGFTKVTIKGPTIVTAIIDLEARGDESGCTGTLANGIDTYIAVSNASGTITFTNVTSGTYTLWTKEDHHLRHVRTNLAISGDSTINVGAHLAGDVNGSNDINVFDGAITQFYKFFGYNIIADIDGNSSITDADLQWVRTNFGKSGE